MQHIYEILKNPHLCLVCLLHMQTGSLFSTPAEIERRLMVHQLKGLLSYTYAAFRTPTVKNN